MRISVHSPVSCSTGKVRLLIGQLGFLNLRRPHGKFPHDAPHTCPSPSMPSIVGGRGGGVGCNPSCRERHPASRDTAADQRERRQARSTPPAGRHSSRLFSFPLVQHATPTHVLCDDNGSGSDAGSTSGRPNSLPDAVGSCTSGPASAPSAPIARKNIRRTPANSQPGPSCGHAEYASQPVSTRQTDRPTDHCRGRWAFPKANPLPRGRGATRTTNTITTPPLTTTTTTTTPAAAAAAATTAAGPPSPSCRCCRRRLRRPRPRPRQCPPSSPSSRGPSAPRTPTPCPSRPRSSAATAPCPAPTPAGCRRPPPCRPTARDSSACCRPPASLPLTEVLPVPSPGGGRVPGPAVGLLLSAGMATRMGHWGLRRRKWVGLRRRRARGRKNGRTRGTGAVTGDAVVLGSAGGGSRGE